MHCFPAGLNSMMLPNNKTDYHLGLSSYAISVCQGEFLHTEPKSHWIIPAYHLLIQKKKPHNLERSH